jgi:hypothetical protein
VAPRPTRGRTTGGVLEVLEYQVTSKVLAMDTHTRKVIESQKETNENNREDKNVDRITTQKQVGRVETVGKRSRGGGICIKAAPLRASRLHNKTRHYPGYPGLARSQIVLGDCGYWGICHCGKASIAAGWPESEPNPGFTLQTVSW